MTRIEAEHHFRVPLREAYDYITDLEHWPEYWPSLVRVEPGSQWREPGDQTRIVIRLLRHEVPLELTLRRVEPYRVVEYTSVQADLPPVRHERHWAQAGDGFDYRLVVEYEPRRGLRGPYERVLLRWAIARALRQTITNLEEKLGGHPVA
jgi:Polyketide cyclase / dehydrase and lipid transport